MRRGKIKAGWYVLLAVSIAVFLTAAGLFSYVVLFGGGSAPQSADIEPTLQEEPVLQAEQPVSVPEQKNEAVTPVLRSFGGEIEWFDGGKWVPLESVTELEEGDPLAVALKTYKEKEEAEKEKSEAEAQTDAEGEDGETSEQTAPEENGDKELSVKQGKVAEEKPASSPSKPEAQPEQTYTPAPGPAAPAPPADSGKQESDPYL